MYAYDQNSPDTLDTKRLGAIYAAHRAQLVTVAKTALRTASDAEDAVQNVFLQMLEEGVPTSDFARMLAARVRDAAHGMRKTRGRQRYGEVNYYADAMQR